MQKDKVFEREALKTTIILWYNLLQVTKYCFTKMWFYKSAPTVYKYIHIFAIDYDFSPVRYLVVWCKFKWLDSAKMFYKIFSHALAKEHKRHLHLSAKTNVGVFLFSIIYYLNISKKSCKPWYDAVLSIFLSVSTFVYKLVHLKLYTCFYISTSAYKFVH